MTIEKDAVDGQIIRILANSTQPMSAREVTRAIRGAGTRVGDRTVRRRLGLLVGSNEIRMEGAGRATRYGSLTNQRTPAANADYPPLSTEGRRALARVRRPLMQRKPVGYRADFLLGYDPGNSAYLSAEEREQLKKLGETPDLTEAAGTFARDLAERLLIDLSWASSQLEGNTYSLLDTERLIQHGQAAQGKGAEETQMILNHKRAIEILVEGAEEIAFNRFTLMSLHAALSENLLPDPAHEGRLRTREVGITQSAYTPISIPQRIEEYFDILLAKLQRIPDPFEQAFFAMVHLPYLQPFEDVNKRTSRLAANIPFIKGNFIPLSFLDVSRDAYLHGLLAIYEDNDVGLLKDIFLAAYERSSQKYHVVREAIGEPNPFRQKHRSAIHNAVRSIVMNELPATTDALVAHALRAGIALPAEHRQFASMVLAQIGLVTAENAGRYGLTPSQFQAWQR